MRSRRNIWQMQPLKSEHRAGLTDVMGDEFFHGSEGSTIGPGSTATDYSLTVN
jgi:hypothetical protein